MEQSVYCAENHTAKQTTNQKNRPFDFVVMVLTMMIQVIIMITMKQNIKKAMKVAMMMDIQKVNPNMRMKMNS